MGTRIQAVLGDTPKLLAPVGGRTYLAYLLDWLAFFGAKRIVFGLGHGAEAIRAEFEEHPRTNLSIITVVELEPLGTGGAIGFSRDQLRSNPVLVLNGDTFVDADLCEFVAFHRAGGSMGSMLCTQVADGRPYGQVRIDTNGNITEFVEKAGGSAGVATINAGIYLLSAPLLNMIARTHKSSLERDIFPTLKAGALRAFTGAFEFIDIGTPDALARATNTLKHVSSAVSGPVLNDH
jgi:mannose-1-phosphate guanylyltransferase